MTFDDVINHDQRVIKNYFCSGRQNGVSVFYLCQSLHKIAKHCIREKGDWQFLVFKEFCDAAWAKKHGFVVINIWDEPYCGRYWSNYDAIYIPKKYLP